MPVVTTLHTMLRDPNPDQRRVFEEIVSLSDRLVVMSELGAEFLQSIYHVPPEKIDLIPHGIPDVPFVDPGFHKDLFGVEGKTHLQALLQDGRPESLCQVIRDLSTYQKQKIKPLNDNDHLVLKQCRNTLLGEWAFVLSLTHAQAEHELHRLLTSVPLETA